MASCYLVNSPAMPLAFFALSGCAMLPPWSSKTCLVDCSSLAVGLVMMTTSPARGSSAAVKSFVAARYWHGAHVVWLRPVHGARSWRVAGAGHLEAAPAVGNHRVPQLAARTARRCARKALFCVGFYGMFRGRELVVGIK